MESTNITILRKNLYKQVDSVIKYDEPITITTKSGNAVLISEKEYNNLMETLYLTSNKKLVEEIKKGEKEDISKMKEYDPKEKW